MALFSIESIILTVFIVWIIYFIYNSYKTKNEPPTVPYVPIIGHTFEIRQRPKQFLESCREKYGDIFAIHFLGHKIFVFSNHAAKLLLKDHEMDSIEGRDQLFFITKALANYVGSPGGPKDFLDIPALVREVVTPMLKTLLPDVLKVMNYSVKEQLGDIKDFKVVNLEKFIANTIAPSVSRMILGPILCKHKDLITLLRDYAASIEKTFIFGLTWSLIPFIGSKISQIIVDRNSPSVKVRAFIKNKIGPYIEDRKKRQASGEVLSVESVVDALCDKGYNVEQISQSVMILAFVSISTTSRNTTLLLLDLLAFPDNFKTIRKEQDTILSNLNREINDDLILTKEEMEKMVHINSAIRETLRHRSYVIEGWRLTKKDFILPNGMKIPKNSIVAVDLPSIHFNPENYGSKSSKENNLSLPIELQYNPFQFVKTNIKATRTNTEFLSFGFGRHSCPGRFFAVQEITSLVSLLLRKFRIETLDGKRMPFYTSTFDVLESDVVFKPRN